MADTFVSFSNKNTMDFFPTFKSFHEPTNNNSQESLVVDEKSVEEQQTKNESLPTEKPKKKKRPHKILNNSTIAGPTPTVLCDICSVPISGPIVFDSHSKGKKHQTQLKVVLTKNPEYKAPTYEELCLTKKQESAIVSNESEKTSDINSELAPNEQSTVSPLAPPKIFNCNMCNISCNSQQMYDNHIAGKRHQAKIKLNNTENPDPLHPAPDNNPSSSNYCDVCSIKFNSENELAEHLSFKRHQLKAKEAEYCAKEGADMNINFNDYRLADTDVDKNKFDFQCTICKKKLRNKIQLIGHLKSPHHIRLANRTSNANYFSKEMNRGNNQNVRTGTMHSNRIARGHIKTSFRGSSRPVEKPRSFTSQRFSRNRNRPFHFQSHDQSYFEKSLSEVFGAFDPHNQYSLNNNNNSFSSSKRPIDYEADLREYEAFFPKRVNKYNDETITASGYYAGDKDYYSSSNIPTNSWDSNSYSAHIDPYDNQSSSVQSSWQYSTDHHYDQQTQLPPLPQHQQKEYNEALSNYTNQMHYSSSQPPLPTYEPPPLPNYPAPSSYTRSQTSNYQGPTGNMGHNAFFQNAFGQ